MNTQKIHYAEQKHTVLNETFLAAFYTLNAQKIQCVENKK